MSEIWRTVSLGHYADGASYRAAIKNKGVIISDAADKLLDAPGIWASRIEAAVIKLVVRSMAELGLKGEAEYAYIARRAQEKGLQPCPAEVGPALCLQYTQPEGEWLIVAMNPVFVSKRDSKIFGIGHGHVHTKETDRTLVAAPSYKRWVHDRSFIFWQP